MKNLRKTMYEKFVILFKPQLTLVFVMILFLVACNSENDPTTEVNSDQPTTEITTENTNTSETTNEENTSNPLETQAQCTNIQFKKDTLVNGNELAHCMMATMSAVKTGTQFVQSSSGSSSNVNFQWDPEFSMYIEADDSSIILTDDSGWMNLDGQWIEEDETSEDIDVIIATNTIKLTRVFAHPYMMTQYLGAVNEWQVIEHTEVPDTKAFEDKAWKLTPTEPVNFNGIMLSDVELWITDEYLGAYYVATSSLSGITETTSNTFTQWGQPITIPQPF